MTWHSCSPSSPCCTVEPLISSTPPTAKKTSHNKLIFIPRHKSIPTQIQQSLQLNSCSIAIAVFPVCALCVLVFYFISENKTKGPKNGSVCSVTVSTRGPRYYTHAPPSLLRGRRIKAAL